MATSNAQRALLLAVSLASSATSPPPTTPPVPGWVGPAPGAGTRWPKWQWPPTNMSRVRHATTATIYVGEQGSGTYNHGPIVTWWRGSFFVCWYSSPRDEGSQQRRRRARADIEKGKPRRAALRGAAHRRREQAAPRRLRDERRVAEAWQLKRSRGSVRGHRFDGGLRFDHAAVALRAAERRCG